MGALASLLATACASDGDDASSAGAVEAGSDGTEQDAGAGDQEGDGDESAGGDFVGRVDMGTISDCDPREQDCPEGTKCAAVDVDGAGFWNGNRCVPVHGDGVAGDACEVTMGIAAGEDDCDVGFMCWDVDPDGRGRCVAQCRPGDECDAGTICSVQNDGVLPLCLASCDPLAQNCPPGEGCYAMDGTGGLLICLPQINQAGNDGDPCVYDNGCVAGLACLPGASGCTEAMCCTPWCEVGQACPTPGEECVQHYASPPPGTDNVGVCVVPQ